MGLENGILIIAKSIKGEDFLQQFNEAYPDFSDRCWAGQYELAYWRKCWNVKNKFYSTFEQLNEEEGGGNLKIKDLFRVKAIMKYFLDESHWDSNGSSIWTWEEQIRNIAQIIFLVSNLLEDIEYEGITDSDIEIEFYDSF